MAQIQGLGEKGEAAKNPPVPRQAALAKVSKRKSMNKRLVRTNPSLPNRDPARAESLRERRYPSIDLEKSIDERSNARGRSKDQKQTKD